MSHSTYTEFVVDLKASKCKANSLSFGRIRMLNSWPLRSFESLSPQRQSGVYEAMREYGKCLQWGLENGDDKTK